MALGSARLLNIRLPLNFNSPYKAVNIQDFWRRWHMTLSRFLRDYVYIPLGGSKYGNIRMLRNIFLTFLIGGIWHGAGWTFAVWGALHGFAMVFHRLWQIAGIRMPRIAGWILTFLFVNATWVYFRAETFADANSVLSAMAKPLIWGAGGLTLSEIPWWLPFIILFIIQDIFFRNSQSWSKVVRPTGIWSTISAGMFIGSTLLVMSQNRFSEFLYFQF